MNIRKAKITNEIIPPLLSLFKDYNSNLRTRLKVNSFFLSFDERSKKAFNKFVLLSNERFKLMKYGGNLNHIISKQKNNYTKINNDIKNDILFTTNYQNIERNKLIKGVNILKSKEIFSMREKLYETLRYNSPYDQKIKKQKKKLLGNETLSERGKNIPKSERKSTYRSLTFNTDNEKEQLELIQSNTKEAIKKDEENFLHGLETYKLFLKNKKTELKDKEGKEDKNVIKINKNDFDDIESHIKENNIKILTYKTKSSDSKHKKKKEDTKFDINILYKIKNYNSKQRKNIFPKLKSIETKEEDLLTNEEIFRKRARNSNYNINYKTFNNNIDMKNTIGIINKEAKEGVDLDIKFKNQKNKFNMYYNTYIGKNNFSDFESNKSFESKESSDDGKKLAEHNSLLKKAKITEHEKLLEDFQKIYEEKKILWKKEDEEKEKMKLAKKKEKEEIINFLFNLENNKK